MNAIEHGNLNLRKEQDGDHLTYGRCLSIKIYKASFSQSQNTFEITKRLHRKTSGCSCDKTDKKKCSVVN